ncbi:MAG: 3-coathanger stack domain-containing protein, partial [Bacteroidota bacterium]
RARESRFQANGSPLYTLNSKFYDEKEQLIRKLQGGTGLSNPAQAWLQQYDYTYLENGLLHKINTANITGSQRPLLDCPVALPNPALPVIGNLDNQDLFYLELAYDVPFNGTSATSQKNGNVTGIKWQVRGREKQGYSLHYDIYNRMTNADYFDENGSGTVTESGIYDVALTYDQRGNIQTLSRYGLTPTKNCYEPALIDQLDYEYRDSNQLALVKDAAPCPDSTYLTPTIDNSQLHAADTKIEADNLINSSVNVTYQAGEEIVLTPGFRVPAGMSFTAQIGPCPQSGFETGGYSQRNLDTTRYDVNGNLAIDPQKAISTTYNHLDLPKQILLVDGKSVNFVYSADGTLLSKEVKDAEGNRLSIRDYIGGVEYLDGVLESIYHAEGRLNYINGTPQMEYTASDQVGNTRLVYADLDKDGLIYTPNEILDEVHYYPNGLKMEGYWMNSSRFRYTFNSIEAVEEFGLNLNMATYRTLDPELGRWWGVDPQAAHAMGLTPYNSMYNSPLVFNDPNGDCPVCVVAAVAAVVNGGINVANQALKGNVNNFWQGLEYFGVGAAAGATTVFNPWAGRAINSVGNKVVQYVNGQFDPSEIDNAWDVAGLALDVGLDAFQPSLSTSLAKPISTAINRQIERKAWEQFARTFGEDVIVNSWKGGFEVAGATVELTAKQAASNGARSVLPQLGRKLDFVFGKATGSAHNIERSTDMLRNLNRIGVFDNAAGRSLFRSHLNETFNATEGIIQANGRVLRESLLMGPRGGVKVTSIWDKNKLITIILKGG